MRKMKKKNINLYEQYEKTVGKAKRKKLSIKTIGIICSAAGLAVLTGVYFIFYTQMKNMKSQYDDLYSKIYSDEAAEQSVNSERLEYENQILSLITEKHFNNREAIENQNKQTQDLTLTMISDILSCQGEETKIKNISYDKGIVFISGEANDVRHASGFVSRLEDKGLFEYISYTGYVLQGNVYVFSATGYFNVYDMNMEGGQ